MSEGGGGDPGQFQQMLRGLQQRGGTPRPQAGLAARGRAGPSSSAGPARQSVFARLGLPEPGQRSRGLPGVSVNRGSAPAGLSSRREAFRSRQGQGLSSPSDASGGGSPQMQAYLADLAERRAARANPAPEEGPAQPWRPKISEPMGGAWYDDRSRRWRDDDRPPPPAER